MTQTAAETEAGGAVQPSRRWLLQLRLGATLSAAVLAPMLLVWYPRPLFEAAGTARLPVFLAVVAVLLGPLVIFVRNRPGKVVTKPALRSITVAQLIAVAGCALALYVQRPVYLVFNVDRFDLVLAKDIAPQDLAKAKGEFMRRPLSSPEYAAVVQPADTREGQRILDIALGGGKDLQAYPQHFVPYGQQASNALKRAKPLDTIRNKDPDAVQGYLASSGRAEVSIRVLPLRAKKRDGVVLLDAQSGMPLGVLLVDPW